MFSAVTNGSDTWTMNDTKITDWTIKRGKGCAGNNKKGQENSVHRLQQLSNQQVSNQQHSQNKKIKWKRNETQSIAMQKSDKLNSRQQTNAYALVSLFSSFIAFRGVFSLFRINSHKLEGVTTKEYSVMTGRLNNLNIISFPVYSQEKRNWTCKNLLLLVDSLCNLNYEFCPVCVSFVKWRLYKWHYLYIYICSREATLHAQHTTMLIRNELYAKTPWKSLMHANSTWTRPCISSLWIC